MFYRNNAIDNVKGFDHFKRFLSLELNELEASEKLKYEIKESLAIRTINIGQIHLLVN